MYEPLTRWKPKPTRLKGTPARRFAFWTSTAVVVSLPLFCYWLSTLEAIQERVKRWRPVPEEVYKKHLVVVNPGYRDFITDVVNEETVGSFLARAEERNRLQEEPNEKK